MAKGKKTPRDVEVAFRELYLHNSNASECARKLQIPTSTAVKLAREADNDPEFAKACQELLSRACRVADIESINGLKICAKALKAPPLEDAMGNPIDKRADLQRAIVATRDSFDRTLARREARDEKAREKADAAKQVERPERIVILRYSDTKPKPPEDASGSADSPERPAS